ncbi:late embryogenesis abundant protein D-34-like [Dorcoceras hygrometricum]|uniref:Late embryogenesis abundant protein D-34-like n=1 Tax=Dorcoceras hygrometricum TaxID=472368 RepID=A0A2Z7AUB6_9LAMI|nr:late embryogenesis abundant protein D-34-like [Dorcoceras hygrometricum]
MNQEQLQRPEAVKYGDVFQVSGELARTPIAPQDAATMQAAESMALGKTLKGGVAATMQSAAQWNERSGVVGHNDLTNIVSEQGASVSEIDVEGNRVITEAIGGQVLGQYGQPTEVTVPNSEPAVDPDACTIGEALEATALSAADKPVDESDAAAIQAAEIRATGHVVPGGVGAEAKSAAENNARIARDEGKTTLGDLLMDATEKLPADKAVTRRDAERVIAAEIRNTPDGAAHPGGVAASMAAAARLNRS